MTNNAVKHEQLIAEIGKLMESYKRRYLANKVLQWIFTTILAAAGGLTSVAGVQQGSQPIESAWFSSPTALLAWGLISAIGAGLNQVAGPGKASERQLNVKLTLRRIRFDLMFAKLPVTRAADLVGIAEKDPERAHSELEKELERLR